MKFSATAKWVNQQGAPLVLAAILLLFCGFAHIVAIEKMGIVNGQFPIMNLRTERSVAAINFLNSNRWIAWVFVAAFIGGLCWLELRAAPRWSVWLAFILFTAPCAAYWIVCAYIGGKVIF